TYDLMGERKAAADACRGRIGGDVDAAKRNAAAVRSQQARDHANERGLAGAVRSDQADEIAGLHRACDAADGLHPAEPDRDIIDREHSPQAFSARTNRPWTRAARPPGARRITSPSMPPNTSMR